jgi:hypothetical protein
MTCTTGGNQNRYLTNRLSGNCNTTLIFSSFLKSNIKTTQDIWDENSKQLINCDLLYSKLTDKINCISEYSKIKKCIPKDYLNFFKKMIIMI